MVRFVGFSVMVRKRSFCVEMSSFFAKMLAGVN